ncbi:T9SS type A sorting domain-containing protein, partial [Flavobacteriales bacterium]|nr:T9SS type A sorting domain-containing protein [Flavobacteriales bacterium]
VNINNFEYLKFGLLNVYNSNISSDGSQYSLFQLHFDDLNYDIDLLFENTNIFDQISINGSQQSTSVTFNNCDLIGSLYTDDVHNLTFNNCTFKDNDNFSFVLNNGDCSMCKTIINSCYFNNNQGGYYSNYYMIKQIGGNLEINNSTFYNNDNVIYFNSGLEIDINSTTFYQNDNCLNLNQWGYPDETGSVKFYNSIVGNIDFGYGSSIIMEGYNIFSNSLNNLPETNFDGISDLNLTLIEDDSSVTPYLLADSCSVAHDNGDPDFEGSIVNAGIPVNIKDIGSAERTDICDGNEPTWDCNTDYACVELFDGSGVYSSLNDCEANCFIESWFCDFDNGGCVDPLDGLGSWSSLDDCEKWCQNVSSVNENIIDVNIYPNPSSNIFNLEFNSDFETEILVTNVLGEQVYFESIKSIGEFNTQIDLSNYSKGIYNLTIKTSDGLSNHKLILQ